MTQRFQRRVAPNVEKAPSADVCSSPPRRIRAQLRFAHDLARPDHRGTIGILRACRRSRSGEHPAKSFLDRHRRCDHPRTRLRRSSAALFQGHAAPSTRRSANSTPGGASRHVADQAKECNAASTPRPRPLDQYFTSVRDSSIGCKCRASGRKNRSPSSTWHADDPANRRNTWRK